MSFSNTQDEQPRRRARNSPRRTRISKEPEERRQENDRLVNSGGLK